MKRIGIKLSGISKILNIPENELKTVLNEIEYTPFRKFYDFKNGMYYGYILEAIKYYRIVKNNK